MSPISSLKLEDLREVVLPLIAGAAYVLGRAESITAASVSWLLPCVALFVVACWPPIARLLRDANLAALALGFAPVMLAAYAIQPSVSTLQDPVLWCLATPFAMWCCAVRLLDRPGAQTRTAFLLTNTLATAALLVPIVGGRIHWGIIILPFAVFRIASSTADKIRLSVFGTVEAAAALAEARATAGRIQWIGGAWVAGWAGVLPSQ